MRSSTALTVAAIIAGLAAASPVQNHYAHVNCAAPQLWHTCSDGWAGCCTTSPCNASGDGKSYCTDAPTTTTTTTPISTPISTPTSTPSSVPGLPPPASEDILWKNWCKEDDSDCHWKPMYYNVKTYNETWARNLTKQFHVHKEDGLNGGRTDAIAVFSNIPDTVSKCRIGYVLFTLGLS